MEIKIKYNGKYPNLCRGNLFVTISGSEILRANKEWGFGQYNLSSGGSIAADWSESYAGPWTISEFPKEFPDELKPAVVAAVNENIEHGCCGGCI